MFLAVEPRRLYRQVADQIRAMIAKGELVVGQRLPPERDLAEKLAVSRPTIREALIVLEVEGLVHIRMGSGIYVARPHTLQSTHPEREPVEGPFELLQARAIIECAIAEEAAQRATASHIATLDENLKQMASAVDDTNAALTVDRGFHTAIAAIVGNSALIRFTGEIYDLRMTPYFEKLASYFEGPESWTHAMEEHRAIRDAIAANDPLAAKQAMRAHLDKSQTRFSESFGEELIGEDESGRAAALQRRNPTI